MKKTVIFISAAILCLAVTAFTIQAIINWKIDNANAMVKFTAGGTKGFFTGVKGDISFDKDDLASSFFNCSIDVGTVNTGNVNKDNHIRTADFFYATKFPVITFRSFKVEKDKDGFIALGNRTIKDSTKQISIPFKFEDNQEKGVFKGEFTIDRNDYGVGKPDIRQSPWGGPVKESAPVTITIAVPVDKK